MGVRYLFENHAFDSERRELRRGDEIVPIAPQVFDLLEYLIRNRERVVTKDDLIHAVWNGRAVSDAALTTRLNAARNAIDDTGEAKHLIKTLPRKGFRFVGAVIEDQPRASEPADSATHDSDVVKVTSSAPRLSIVVLPFANLSGDPHQEYFVDGVTESLTTDLSRISGSFVIGRHTAFTYKGKAVDLRQVGRELNVRYVLEGSVQRGCNRLRASVQLIDAETGNHLWAERFDKPLADLFDMQDEIVSRLANMLNVQLTIIEARRAERLGRPQLRSKSRRSAGAIRSIRYFDPIGVRCTPSLTRRSSPIRSRQPDGSQNTSRAEMYSTPRASLTPFMNSFSLSTNSDVRSGIKLPVLR